jgi:hypothetical protein
VHARAAGGGDVVVDAVADVQHLVGLGRDDLGDALEEQRVGLARAPVVRGADQVDVAGEQVAQDLPGADGLVSGDAEPEAVGAQGAEAVADVGVEVVLAEVLRLPSLGAALSLGVEVEARPELLERLAVVAALGDDRPEHRREGVAGDAEPVRPGAVLPGLVYEALANVEDHSANHGADLIRA